MTNCLHDLDCDACAWCSGRVEDEPELTKREKAADTPLDLSSVGFETTLKHLLGAPLDEDEVAKVKAWQAAQQKRDRATGGAE